MVTQYRVPSIDAAHRQLFAGMTQPGDWRPCCCYMKRTGYIGRALTLPKIDSGDLTFASPVGQGTFDECEGREQQ